MSPELKMLYIKILKLGCIVDVIHKSKYKYYITLGSNRWPYYTVILEPVAKERE